MEAMITHGLHKICRGNDENSGFVLTASSPLTAGELFDSVVLLLILLAVQKSTVEDGE